MSEEKKNRAKWALDVALDAAMGESYFEKVRAQRKIMFYNIKGFLSQYPRLEPFFDQDADLFARRFFDTIRATLQKIKNTMDDGDFEYNDWQENEPHECRQDYDFREIDILDRRLYAHYFCPTEDRSWHGVYFAETSPKEERITEGMIKDALKSLCKDYIFALRDCDKHPAFDHELGKAIIDYLNLDVDLGIWLD